VEEVVLRRRRRAAGLDLDPLDPSLLRQGGGRLGGAVDEPLLDAERAESRSGRRLEGIEEVEGCERARECQ